MTDNMQQQQQQQQEFLCDTLNAMRLQEQRTYTTHDFLDATTTTPNLDIDSDCFVKMAEWCYQIVDFCSFQRETVEIAMNYLARYLHTDAGQLALQDRTVFQLASMSTLYTAVKMFETEAMDPQTVSKLSKGFYTAKQIEDMEQTIINALQWHMNPPTAAAFVRNYVELIPESIITDKKTLLDIAIFQTELAVTRYEYINVKNSIRAFAAVVNALESMHLDDKTINYICYGFSKIIDSSDLSEFTQIREHLYSLAAYNDPHLQQENEESAANNMTSQSTLDNKVEINFEESPRTTTAVQQR